MLFDARPPANTNKVFLLKLFLFDLQWTFIGKGVLHCYSKDFSLINIFALARFSWNVLGFDGKDELVACGNCTVGWWEGFWE